MFPPTLWKKKENPPPENAHFFGVEIVSASGINIIIIIIIVAL